MYRSTCNTYQYAPNITIFLVYKYANRLLTFYLTIVNTVTVSQLFYCDDLKSVIKSMSCMQF